MTDTPATPEPEGMFPRMYDTLRRLAEQYVRRERASHTLQPTALVHELWIRVQGSENLPDEGDPGFLAAASKSIRRILMDHAKRRNAKKRGGRGEKKLQPDEKPDDPVAAAAVRGGTAWSRVTLQEGIFTSDPPEIDLIDLETAMQRLEAQDEQACRVVELRFFCGLTNDETAVEMGLEPQECTNIWRFARTWLKRELKSYGTRS